MKSHRSVIRKHELVSYKPEEFFLLFHNRYDKDYEIGMHWHNSIEITYVVKGEKIYKEKTEQGIKTIDAKTGKLIVVNSGISHELSVKKGLEGIVLLINRDSLSYFFPESEGVDFTLEGHKDIEKEIIELMLELMDYYNSQKKTRQHINVLKIMTLMVENLIDTDNVYKEKHDEMSELILSVTEYIDYNYKTHITLEDIASMTHYNKVYLSGMFKKVVGINIFEYIKNVRLQHCLIDLKETNRTIVDIALSNGFANIQTFNKTFKEIYHQTPAEYRKNK